MLFVDQFIKIYVKTHLKIEEHIPAVQFMEPSNTSAEILFVENPGMAFGYELWGEHGKLFLSLFRIVAAVLGVFYIRHIIRTKEYWGYIFCTALIFAGAVGNIIDSAFYGIIFSSSEYDKVATLFPPGGGYQTFLHGKVVDMIHLPFWHGQFPSWFPFWANQDFEFFSPIFNVADFSISTGVISIFFFQKKFFQKKNEETLLQSEYCTEQNLEAPCNLTVNKEVEKKDIPPV